MYMMDGLYTELYIIKMVMREGTPESRSNWSLLLKSGVLHAHFKCMQYLVIFEHWIDGKILNVYFVFMAIALACAKIEFVWRLVAGTVRLAYTVWYFGNCLLSIASRKYIYLNILRNLIPMGAPVLERYSPFASTNLGNTA